MSMPETRIEYYLNALSAPSAQGPNFPKETLSRIEMYLEAILGEYHRILEELKKRTEYVEIYFKDGYLKDKNDKILTYQEVQDMVIDPSKYVVCIWYELCLIPVFWLGDAIEFSETHIIENEPYINRVIINAQNQIKFEEMHLQKGN